VEQQNHIVEGNNCVPSHPEPTDAYQVFGQQQDIFRMMATTIGSSISKGLEMPRREYMTFDGNPLKYPSFIQNFKTNVEDIERDPNARRRFLIQLCTGEAMPLVELLCYLQKKDIIRQNRFCERCSGRLTSLRRCISTE
jgi:hypothetical protein